FPGLAGGYELGREIPKGARAVGRTYVLVHGEKPSEDPRHLAVDQKLLGAERDARDRPGPGLAATPDGPERRGVARDFSSVLLHDLARPGVQSPRAPVIAEAAPRTEHLRKIGPRQVPHAGVSLEETREIVEHRRDPRLLQHHFRKPDC